MGDLFDEKNLYKSCSSNFKPICLFEDSGANV